MYDAAAVVRLVLQTCCVMAAGLPADSVVAPADQQLAARSVEVTVTLVVALVVVVAVGLDGLVMLQTHVAEVAALAQAVAPAVRSVLVKPMDNYRVQLHSDQIQDLPLSPGAEQPPMLADLVMSQEKASTVSGQYL